MSAGRSNTEKSPAAEHEGQSLAIRASAESSPQPQAPRLSHHNGVDGDQQGPVEGGSTALRQPVSTETGSGSGQTTAQTTAPSISIGQPQDAQPPQHGAQPPVVYHHPPPNPPPGYQHPLPYAQPPPPPQSYNSSTSPPPSSYVRYASYQPPPPPPPPPQGLRPIQPRGLGSIPPAHSHGNYSHGAAYAPQYHQPGPPPPNWSNPYPYAHVSPYYQAPVQQPAPPPKPAPKPDRKLPNPAFPAAQSAPPPIPPPLYLPGPPNPRPPRENAALNKVVTLPDGTTRVRRSRGTYQRLTRDTRRDILLMRRLGYQYESIAKFLGTTTSAVAYTVTKGTAETAHHNAGRRTRIRPEKQDQMIKYVQQYLAAERAAGVDKKTGKKKMTPLTYNMIRDAVFRDENGEIPSDLKFTDDALKQMLNRRGLWLRTPYSQMQKDQLRARGLKQWQTKLAKDKQGVSHLSSALPTSDAQQNPDMTAQIPIEFEDDENETSVVQGYAEQELDDDEAGDVYSETESELDDDGEEDMVVEQQLRRAMERHPIPHG